MSYCIIFSTAGTVGEATKIADALLSAHAASCVQMSPVNSMYHWKGKIEKSDEILLTIKTKDELYSAAEKIIRENHSYEVPQIIKVPITDGLPDYLNWIKKETK